MLPTKTWISKKFDIFNKEYFNGELDTPEFEISTTRSCWGQCTWKWERGTTKKVWTGTRYKLCPDYKRGSAKIRISKFFDVAEHDIEQVLIHEMVHLYFVQNNMEWVGHGRLFKKKASEITKQGRHKISVRDDFNAEINKEVANKKRKSYQVFILREKFGSKRYLYIYGNIDKKTQNKKAVQNWINHPHYEYIVTVISDHDIFVGRRSSIKYTTNRASAYFFESETQYEEVVRTSKYTKKAA